MKRCKGGMDALSVLVMFGALVAEGKIGLDVYPTTLIVFVSNHVPTHKRDVGPQTTDHCHLGVRVVGAHYHGSTKSSNSYHYLGCIWGVRICLGSTRR